MRRTTWSHKSHFASGFSKTSTLRLEPFLTVTADDTVDMESEGDFILGCSKTSQKAPILGAFLFLLIKT